MKKSFSFFSQIAAIVFTVLFVFGLFSCSSFLTGNAENGSVSFVIDRAVLDAARDGSGIHDENASYLVDVTLEDGNGFGVKQTVTITSKDYDDCMATDRKFEAKFPRVPVGKQIYAIVKLYRIFGEAKDIPESELPEPEMIGKSDSIKVKSGKNEITLHAYNYRYNFDFSVTIAIEGFSENQFSQLEQNLLISAISSDSQGAKRLAAAGTNQVKIYEALSDNYDVEGQMAFSYGSQFSYDPSSKKVTVKGKMALPVSLDSAATNGKEVVLVAGIYELDPYSGKKKTKLFGQSKISPEKKKTNTVSISASRMDFIDTPVVTFSEINDGYSYAINGIPRDQYTATEKGFCFDKDGNFYVLNSKTPGQNYSNYEIKSSSFSSPITVDGTFEYAPSIAVDMKTDIMYVYSTNGYTLSLSQYPNLISVESISDSQNWRFACGTVSFEKDGNTYQVEPYPQLCTVYNNWVYILAEDKDTTSNCGYFVYYSYLTTPDDNVVMIADGYHLDIPYGFVTDMICLDGDLYIIGEDVYRSWEDATDSLSSRGFVLKYNPKKYKCEYIAVSSDKKENTSMNNIKMPVYKSDLQIFTDSARIQPLLVSGSIMVGGKSLSEKFPTLYTPSPMNKTLSTSALYGASKILAIKPKKLVIAEEGFAYYTENDQLFYKNINRLVTVDLEDFSMKFDNTDASFDLDKNDIFKKQITTDSAFWDATVGIGTRLFPGVNGSEFDAGTGSGTYYLAIPLKQN